MIGNICRLERDDVLPTCAVNFFARFRALDETDGDVSTESVIFI